MKVLLGVTGGIAAYKSLELVRLFVKNGDDVQVVMTAGAKEFIQPLSFQALSGKPVRDSLFDTDQEAGMGHIDLARWADLIVIAPATAETLAKMRMGRADDLLMTLCLATDKPILLAPAMNRLMWLNEATQENISVLKNRGYQVLTPDEGEQACGEVGAGRLPEPEQIFLAAHDFYHQQVQQNETWNQQQVFWKGKKLLITAGPTFEPIDPVRFIGNRSSGKMGLALAEIASKLGATVTVISGPVSLEAPTSVEVIRVKTAKQMLEAVTEQYAQQDVFIAAAAVADYRVAEPAEQKIKKQSDQETLTLNLVKNPDIVAWVAQQQDKPFVVGFAAETQNMETYAVNKLKQKNLDMICANQVGQNQGFEQDDNALILMTEHQSQALSLSSKKDQAFQLLSFLSKQL